MPYCPLMISPASNENHDTPMPIARPAQMLGSAPGRTTWRKMHMRGTERLRRANEYFWRLLHAVKGVQNDREQRAEEGDVDDRAFLGRPEQDGQRNPCDPRDRTQNLDIGEDEVADEPRASHQQTEHDPDAGRQRITD